MTTEIRKIVESKMHKSIESYKHNLAKIRTGRAHAGLLAHIHVDYYGSMMPIDQLSTITTDGKTTIVVQAWEAKMAGNIEKAIRDSDLGLNPISSGSTIRVPMPSLTEQRRKELIKFVKSESEDAKIAIRNVRRDANAELKVKLKDKLISEDDDKRAQEDIQKITDKYIAEIDKLTQEKEKEMMTV